MNNRKKLLIFTVLIIVMSISIIYADRIDTGWKGYGLYNLSKSEVSIANESDTVTINGGNIEAVYEYTIKNNSSEDITVNFGYPDNGIYKFSVHDGSKLLSFKTRDTSYLTNNYNVENLQIPEVKWYLFNMVFTPGQIRTIKVNIDAEMKKSDNDTYSLSFLKDRNYSYAIQSEKTMLSLKVSNFKPYDILEFDGIKPEDISKEGNITLSYNVETGSGASMIYQPVDMMSISRLSASAYKKPKAIVRAFNAKNYNEALTLCNEYIKTPQDNRLNLEQVKYVKAECIRLLNNNEEYVSAAEQLDLTKLFPARIRYKLQLDRLNAYNAMNNDKAIDKILEELIPETQQSYPYFNFWLNQNGYMLSETEQTAVEIATHTENTGTVAKGKGLDVLGVLVKFFTVLKESRLTYIAIGLVFGFIVGRITKRGKKRKSIYLFRD